mgnify:CR=1 FL=1
MTEKYVYTVWIVSDDAEPLLVGVATSEAKAKEMTTAIRKNYDSCCSTSKCRLNTLYVGDEVTIL